MKSSGTSRGSRSLSTLKQVVEIAIRRNGLGHLDQQAQTIALLAPLGRCAILRGQFGEG